MKKISKYFYRKSNLHISLLFTALMVIYASLVLGSKSDCFQSQLVDGMSVFGLKFGFSYSYAVSFFESLNEQGINCYKEFIFIWDNIFPLIYATMYILWLSLIYRDINLQNPIYKLINIYPLIPMLFDWIENIFELRMANVFLETGKLTQNAVFISSLMNQLKWCSSTLNYLVITMGIILLIKIKIKH